MTAFGGDIAVELVMSTTHRSILPHEDDGLTSAVSLLQELDILSWPEVCSADLRDRVREGPYLRDSAEVIHDLSIILTWKTLPVPDVQRLTAGILQRL